MKKPIEPRRYLVAFNTANLAHLFTDVLILGSGAGGLSAALAAAESAEVLVATKDTLQESNTYHAQGGVAVVLDPRDSHESHVRDTLDCGQGLCDPDVVRTVVETGTEVVRDLIERGAEFDRDGDKIASTFEGGHSFPRIIHARGDATGMEIELALTQAVCAHPLIRILPKAFAVDVITIQGRCLGALIYRQPEGLEVVWAKATILATGGAGQLYRETTNPRIATGDGLALAYRAGAELRDLEFVQFHPTTLYVAGATRSLISEAVRGEGGILRNGRGERFMPRYDPRAELAPRDIVALSILREMRATGDTCVYLDVTHLAPDLVRSRFPKITELCAFFDLDITKDWIPVRPSAHYMIGGVTANQNAETTVPGLLACGEVSSTGLHGANRLGSNSLLEALVYGRIAGRRAAELSAEYGSERVGPYHTRSKLVSPKVGYLDMTDVKNSLKSLMWRSVGLERNQSTLAVSIDMIDFWNRYVMDKEFSDPESWEIQNMLTTARNVAELALRREESRGCHFRSDFPERNDALWKRHLTIRREAED